MQNCAQGFDGGSGDTSEKIHCSGDSDPLLVPLAAQTRQNQWQLCDEELERKLSDERLEWQLSGEELERKLSEGLLVRRRKIKASTLMLGVL